MCENTHPFYPILVISNDIWSSIIWGIITASLCNFLETPRVFLDRFPAFFLCFDCRLLSCDRVLFLSFLPSHFHFSLRIGQSTAARLLSVLWLNDGINPSNWPTTVLDSNSVHLHPEEVTRLLTVFAHHSTFFPLPFRWRVKTVGIFLFLLLKTVHLFVSLTFKSCNTAVFYQSLSPFSFF